MKKLILLTFFTTILLQNAYSADAKFRTLAVTSAYGTVGGLLLGTASLAFGTSGRAVAKGASLGLYAGILFGGYIIVSHSLRSGEWDRYFENNHNIPSSPYDNTNYYDFNYSNIESSKKKDSITQFYMNMVNYTF